MSAGLLPDKPHTALRDADGKLLYEEMLTRGGFSGAFSYFYHRFPVRAHREHGPLAPRLGRSRARPRRAVAARRRLYLSDRVTAGRGCSSTAACRSSSTATSTILLARAAADRRRLLRQRRRRRALVRPRRRGPPRVAVRMARRKAGDYVWVPKAMIHRWHVPSGSRADALLRGARRRVDPAAFRNPVGQLQIDAPYTHRDFVRPAGPIATFAAPLEGPRELLVKKRATFTRYVLERPPMDVVGWDGFVYPVGVRRSRNSSPRPASFTCRPRCTRRSRARACSCARSCRA